MGLGLPPRHLPPGLPRRPARVRDRHAPDPRLQRQGRQDLRPRLKGSNSGEHHLVREEARALRAWLKVRGPFPGPIFLSKQKRPIDRTTRHLLMKKYGAAAGIQPHLRRFHVLKHCCATHLLSKGFGVERVPDWIGHANIQSTMEYAKVTNARRDDMAQQLKETWR